MTSYSFVTHKEGEKTIVIAINDDSVSHIIFDGGYLSIFSGDHRIAYLWHTTGHSAIISVSGPLRALIEEVEQRMAKDKKPATVA